jgi:hypothetical protein
MAESKYGKIILRQTKPHAKISAATPSALEGVKDWAGIQHRMNWKYIAQPVLIDEGLHTHDFDEFFCFLGSDPNNAFDFGAEVEVKLGKEGEKQVVTNSTIICIPKGLVHGSVNFKKVEKPVIFANIYLAPEYVKKPVSK